MIGLSRGRAKLAKNFCIYNYIYVIQNLTVFPSFPNSPHLGVEDVIISHHYYVILIRKMMAKTNLIYFSTILEI